jgi:D-tyrosyl-tRNA(Tyr) deacylase
VFQRVACAEVRSEDRLVGRIEAGAVVFLGVGNGDTAAVAEKMADKVAKLRVFDDAEGRMNRPLSSLPGGAFLVVSQFTLYADASKGNRPSFIHAAPPEQAEQLYAVFVETLRAKGIRVETGVFRTQMQVELVNDGPVTICLEA